MLCKQQAFYCMNRDTYLETLLILLEQIPSSIVIYRLTGDGPKNLLIAPLWSSDKKRVQNDIRKLLQEKQIYQGGKCLPKTQKQ